MNILLQIIIYDVNIKYWDYKEHIFKSIELKYEYYITYIYIYT